MRKPDIDFLSDAFISGGVRGLHGAGMFTVNKKKGLTWAAQAATGTSFMASEKCEAINKSLSNSILAVGHNRFTTSGEHVDAHCHPFQFGEIIGVHNGGIPESILQTIDPKDSHPVDSARVYAAISKADDPVDVLKEISFGAYALVWYDQSTNNLHFARNGHRPLHVAVTRTGIYFASEVGMLTWLLGRNKIEDTDTEICSLNVKTLYTIPLDDPNNVTNKEYSAAVAQASAGRFQGGCPSQRDPSHDRHSAEAYQTNTQKQETLSLEHNPGGYMAEHQDRGRVFYSAASVTNMFPCLADRMDFIRECSVISEPTGNLVIPTIMLGVDSPYPHVKVIYGTITDKLGHSRKPTVLAYSRGSLSLINELGEWLPEHKIPISDAYYPIMWQYIDSYKVRPTGEIIVQGRPVRDKEIQDSIGGFTRYELDWANHTCSYKYLENQEAYQLCGMWTDLSNGKLLTEDDIPF
jgi:hypothetical protein